MTKIKQLRMQFKVAISLFLVVAVVGIGLGVKAWVSNGETPQTLMENVSINVFNEAQEPTIKPEKELGAIVSPDIISPYLSVNGDITYHITGTFTDATTTIMSIVNPFLRATTTGTDVVIPGTTYSGVGQTGATSTVELVRLNITGVATSTYTIECGVAPADGTTASTTIAYNILLTGQIATSTFTGVIEHDISTSYGSEVAGGTVSKIMIGAINPYLVCVVSTETSDQDRAFTDVGNSFDGVFMVRISKTRF